MGAIAQQAPRTVSPYSFSPKSKKVYTFEGASRAPGDTLLFFDSESFYFENTQDANDFQLENFDGDGLTPNNPNWPASGQSFVYSFYSLKPSDLMQHDVDTAFFLGAVSWFNPAGKADNWFSFGPITIPANGANITWYDRVFQNDYSDGYRVFISTTGAVPYTDVNPSTDTPIFVKLDCMGANCPAQDTIWTQRSRSLSAYAGQRVYVHFNHNADDMNVLYLDHVVIKEAPASVDENAGSTTSLYAFPNPASNVVTFSYALASESNVTINITDITGKVVASINEGTKANGSYTTQFNTAALSAGTYFYSVVTNNGTATKKLVVTK